MFHTPYSQRMTYRKSISSHGMQMEPFRQSHMRPYSRKIRNRVQILPQTDFNALNEDVRALRQEISERFDRLESSMTNSKTKASGSRTKKEVIADE